jgi:hypothetical protein
MTGDCSCSTYGCVSSHGLVGQLYGYLIRTYSFLVLDGLLPLVDNGLRSYFRLLLNWFFT